MGSAMTHPLRWRFCNIHQLLKPVSPLYRFIITGASSPLFLLQGCLETTKARGTHASAGISLILHESAQPGSLDPNRSISNSINRPPFPFPTNTHNNQMRDEHNGIGRKANEMGLQCLCEVVNWHVFWFVQCFAVIFPAKSVLC